MNKSKKTTLTIRQKRLCDIYHAMKKPNKRAAYELAGYACRGKVAKTEAQREMGKSHVKSYLNSLKEVATERAQRTADEIIVELEKIGFSNIKDYLDFGPSGVVLKDSEKLTLTQLAAIESICETTTQHGGTIRFKLYDKPECLHLLGKRHGLFPNKQEIIGKDGGPLELNVRVTKTYKKK